MKLISIFDNKLVCGGNLPQIGIAIGAGYAIYSGGTNIIDSTNSYNEIGHKIGEQIYTITHPDPLGPMVYPEPKQ